ncbi:MAG: hypothetical protein ACOH2H_22220 [Cypionkella sp.]
MGDDRIAGCAERVENSGSGRDGVGFDKEHGADKGRVRPFFDHELAFAKLDCGSGGIFRDEAEGGVARSSPVISEASKPIRLPLLSLRPWDLTASPVSRIETTT